MRKYLSPAMIIALIALFFALTGGAIAAQRFLLTSTDQIKPSVLTDLRGKTGSRGQSGPSGAKGDAGPAGPGGQTGPQGVAGAPGAVGAQGLQGPKGDKGETGATGAQGPKGDKGETGATGTQGPKGDQGDPGPAGPPGHDGTQGPKGDQGSPGADGKNAFELYKQAHPDYTGSLDDWLQSLKGDKGDTGAPGPKGDIGATGAPGPQGPAGPQGATGSTGPQGPAGSPGPAGPQGATGSTGPQGPAGGPNVVKDANGNVVGTSVAYDGGNIWMLLDDGTIEPVNATTGRIGYGTVQDVGFTSTNCSGTAYTFGGSAQTPFAIPGHAQVGDPLYVPSASGQSLAIGSVLNQDGTCDSWGSGQPAQPVNPFTPTGKTISTLGFTGPLTITKQ